MFCPGCGSKNSTAQRFCRGCGINLEPFVDALVTQVPQSTESDDLIRREQRLERFGQFAFGGFGIVVLIAVVGIIYTIFMRMVLGQEPLVGLLLIAFILFAALTLTYVIFSEDLKDRRKKAGRSRDLQPAVSELGVPSPTAKLLEESQFEPATSVTEHATELLPIRNRER